MIKGEALAPVFTDKPSPPDRPLTLCCGWYMTGSIFMSAQIIILYLPATLK